MRQSSSDHSSFESRKTSPSKHRSPVFLETLKITETKIESTQMPTLFSSKVQPYSEISKYVQAKRGLTQLFFFSQESSDTFVASHPMQKTPLSPLLLLIEFFDRLVLCQESTSQEKLHQTAESYVFSVLS